MLKKTVTRIGVLSGVFTLVACSGFNPSRDSLDKQDEIVQSRPVQLVSITPYPLITWVTDVLSAPSVPSWKHYLLPGKRPTVYVYQKLEGREAVSATADSSASMMRQSVHIRPDQLGKIRFSWKVPQLIAGADLAVREMHDSPVRVALSFEGDRSKFSAKNAMLSELARALTGEELPYATLMYVWCNECAPEHVFTNPRTDRIKEVALQSGPEQLNKWLDYERDVKQDFFKAFGEAPGALLDVGIMTDTDNTRQKAVAWYGPISISPP